jgi:hypothetical protein
MAEGSETWEGGAVPLFGESEIQGQTAANDILTLTGASSHTGDFLVMQNSTGAEMLVFNQMSSSANNAITIAVSSTGAMAANASANANAVLVQPTSNAKMNCVVMYDNSATDAQVNSAVAYLGVNGTKAPTYFLTVGTTGGPGEGAAADNGFLDASMTFGAPDATKAAYAGLKCLFGSKAYYILALPDSNMS